MASEFGEATTGNKEVNLNDLPDEVLLNIFQFLSAKDLVNIRLVNRKWAGVNNCVRLRRKFRLRMSNEILSEDHIFVMTMMASGCSYPHLAFSHITFRNTDLLLSLWCKLGPKLRSLEISTGENIPFDYNFYLLMERAIRLESLTLRDDCHVNLDVLDNMPKLQHLSFYVGRHSKIMLPSVRRLHLSLKTLTIYMSSKHRHVDEPIAHAIANAFPNLEELILEQCTSGCMPILFNKGKRIKRLECSIKVLDTEKDLVAIKNIAGLHNLEYLNIYRYGNMLSDEFFIKQFRLPKLTVLYLDGGFHVTDPGILGLVTNCPKLKHIHLCQFPLITDLSVEYFVKKLKDLVELDLLATESKFITENCSKMLTEEEKRKIRLLYKLSNSYGVFVLV